MSLSAICAVCKKRKVRTGITINHADYFQGTTQTRQQKGKLAVEWVNNKDTNRVAKLNMAEYFRNSYAVKGEIFTQYLPFFMSAGYQP